MHQKLVTVESNAVNLQFEMMSTSTPKYNNKHFCIAMFRVKGVRSQPKSPLEALALIMTSAVSGPEL